LKSEKKVKYVFSNTAPNRKLLYSLQVSCARNFQTQPTNQQGCVRGQHGRGQGQGQRSSRPRPRPENKNL